MIVHAFINSMIVCLATVEGIGGLSIARLAAAVGWARACGTSIVRRLGHIRAQWPCLSRYVGGVIVRILPHRVCTSDARCAVDPLS